MSLIRKIKMIILIVTGIIVLTIAIIFSILFINSPGKPRQFLDEKNEVLINSISEKTFLSINGVQQGLFIKGKSMNNPIILYLHGGMPDYFLTEKYPTQLDDNFIMVWWEQRGCGISFDSNSKNNKVTIDQLIEDTIELTRYLLKRFDKNKIYLMGHSGGSFLGIYVIDRAPELFYAYIGISQISNQKKSEQIALDYMLNRYKALNNHKMINILQNISIDEEKELPSEYVKIRDIAMHDLGIGTMKRMKNLFTDLFIPSLLFNEYTLIEKFNLWAGKSKSGISQNWNSMMNINLVEVKNSFSIPIYFFHGIDDYTCSYELAKEYFKKIHAPVKGFYTFHQSAHSPLFEEPMEMVKVLVNDVVNSKIELADKIQ